MTDNKNIEQADNLEIQLKLIDAKLDKITNKPVNIWEKVGILLGVLTPATIAGLGFYINSEINERELAMAEQRDIVAQAMAEKRDRVARLSLVPAFVDALSSNEPKKQLLAIRTIRLVMPEDGPAILEGVVDQDNSPLNDAVKAAAKVELDGQISKWVTDLYSPDKPTRIFAFDAMTNSGVSPELIAPPLVEWSAKNLDNKDGIFNTLRYLNLKPDPAATFQLDPNTLKSLAESAKVNGPSTQILADEFIRKLEP